MFLIFSILNLDLLLLKTLEKSENAHSTDTCVAGIVKIAFLILNQ